MTQLETKTGPSVRPLPTIRALTSEQSRPFAKLHQTCFSTGWSTSDFERFLTDPQSIGFFAKQSESETLDGAILSRLVAGEAEILTIAVAPHQRRIGLGTMLLTKLVEELQRQHTRKLFLEVAETNEAAIGLYKAAKFTQAGRRNSYYKDAKTGAKTDALLLVRTLV